MLFNQLFFSRAVVVHLLHLAATVVTLGLLTVLLLHVAEVPRHGEIEAASASFVYLVACEVVAAARSALKSKKVKR